MAGSSGNAINGLNDFALARYNPNGNLDITFGIGGTVTTDFDSGEDFANALVFQGDGKIVVAGKSYNGTNYIFALARYNPNGNLDTTFGTGGTVTTAIGSFRDEAYALVLQEDGMIVVAGSSSSTDLDFALVRYNPDGSLDTSFGTGGKVITAIGSGYDVATAVRRQADGKLVAAGYSSDGFPSYFSLVRYNPDGSLDSSFGSGGKVTTELGPFDDLLLPWSCKRMASLWRLGIHLASPLDMISLWHGITRMGAWTAALVPAR